MRVLVTGGAGFIGSHLVDALFERGHEVRVLDALVTQVHSGGRPPGYLSEAAELRTGDLRDTEAVGEAVEGCEAVFHLASAVGVGQSMYAVREYVEANVVGTAVLLEEIVARRDAVRKVVVASSMSNYGEGLYRAADGTFLAPRPRGRAQLEGRRWELEGEDGAPLEPLPTDEDKPLAPTSVYATTKRDQEELVLNVCGAYGIPAVALRYFNVYGTRQSLSNPYTGVAAIFAARILNDEPPLVFEDGQQSRDFIHVRDVVRANICALHGHEADGSVVNVGTGRPTSLLELCALLLSELDKPELEPVVTERFREGDIRHCYADIGLARRLLGFEPSVSPHDGISDLADWARDQPATDLVDAAVGELRRHALLR